MSTLSLTKEARIFNGEKIVSLINGAGKTGQLQVKNEIRTLPNTISTVQALSHVQLFATP